MNVLISHRKLSQSLPKIGKKKILPEPDKKGTYDLTKNWEVKNMLGSGASSKVYLAKNKKNNCFAAVKFVPWKLVISNQDLAKEVAMLKQMHHPNVIGLIDVYMGEEYLQIVMDLADGNELFEEICSMKTFSERQARDTVKNILEGVHYIHEKGIIHRDIKMENLIYCSNPDGTSTLKIIDFGFAKNSSDTRPFDYAGTLGYKAPEIFKNEEYSTKADMWSVGVVTYILLCGLPPFFSYCQDWSEDIQNIKSTPFWYFFNEKTQELEDAIKSGNYTFPDAFWGKISKTAKDFVSSLLKVDPNLRLSAAEALKHDWIMTSFANTCELLGSDLATPEKLMSRSNLVRSQRIKVVQEEFQNLHKGQT